MSSQVNGPPNLSHLQVLAFWNASQGWNDPAPDDLGPHIVAGSFRFEAGRDPVDGDVRELPRSALTFRLRNADGRFSPLNAGSPLNQSPKALGAGRPLLVRAAIPDVPTSTPPPVPTDPDVPTTPAAPVVTLYDDPEQLTVLWTEPASGGAAIDAYRLRHRVAGSAAWTDVALDTLTRKTVLANLVNGTAYEVRVSARNSAGWGPWSDAVEAAPDAVPSRTLWSGFVESLTPVSVRADDGTRQALVEVACVGPEWQWRNTLTPALDLQATTPAALMTQLGGSVQAGTAWSTPIVWDPDRMQAPHQDDVLAALVQTTQGDLDVQFDHQGQAYLRNWDHYGDAKNPLQLTLANDGAVGALPFDGIQNLSNEAQLYSDFTAEVATDAQDPTQFRTMTRTTRYAEHSLRAKPRPFPLQPRFAARADAHLWLGRVARRHGQVQDVVRVSVRPRTLPELHALARLRSGHRLRVRATGPSHSHVDQTMVLHRRGLDSTAGLRFTLDLLSADAYSVALAPLFKEDMPAPAVRLNGSLRVVLPEAAGGKGPLTYTLAGTLPRGVAFDGGSRTLSGAPSETGIFDLAYTVTDASGLSDSGPLQLLVGPEPIIRTYTNSSNIARFETIDIPAGYSTLYVQLCAGAGCGGGAAVDERDNGGAGGAGGCTFYTSRIAAGDVWSVWVGGFILSSYGTLTYNGQRGEGTYLYKSSVRMATAFPGGGGDGASSGMEEDGEDGAIIGSSEGWPAAWGADASPPAGGTAGNWMNDPNGGAGDLGFARVLLF